MHRKTTWLPAVLAVLAAIAVVHPVHAAKFRPCIDYLKSVQANPNCSDPELVCPNDSRSNLMFTREGCLNRCGHGFEPDPMSDIIGRTILWLVPALVLVARFHFPPVGLWGTIAVLASLLGNPIGCLYALLTRMEVFSQRHKRARRQLSPDVRIRELNGVVDDLAAVCAACDELGFNDPLPFIISSLERRPRAKGESYVATPSTSIPRSSH
jgi:hypothetical protein